MARGRDQRGREQGDKKGREDVVGGKRAETRRNGSTSGRGKEVEVSRGGGGKARVGWGHEGYGPRWGRTGAQEDEMGEPKESRGQETGWVQEGEGTRSDGKDPTPTTLWQRSHCKDPRPKIRSQRPETEHPKARAPSQRTNADDPKPTIQQQKIQSKRSKAVVDVVALWRSVLRCHLS